MTELKPTTKSGFYADPKSNSQSSIPEYDCKMNLGIAPNSQGPLKDEDQISIDYMANDYESFRKALLDLVLRKNTNWDSSSEGYIGIMFLELFCYIHDELSYLRDRIGQERFLLTSTERQSVEGHLKLIDYNLHNAIAANVFIKITAVKSGIIPMGFQFSTNAYEEKAQIIFETSEDQYVDVMHNKITILELNIDNDTGQPCALLETRLQLKKGQKVLFQEINHNENENENSNSGGEIVTIITDPKFINENTQITWSAKENLNFHYDLNSDYVCANICSATNGKTVKNEVLKERGEFVTEFSFKLKNGPLAYVMENASSEPQSTLKVNVDGEIWEQTNDLLEGRPFDQKYAISVDNFGYTTVIFGGYGMMPSSDSLIEAEYRVSNGKTGNVGKNMITKYDHHLNSSSAISCIQFATNQPAFNGKDIESVDEAKLSGLKSLKVQQRAVVLHDYESLIMTKFSDQVSDVKARHVSTGSMNAIFVAISITDSKSPDAGLFNQIRNYIESIKMIGSDVRIEHAKYISIDIGMTVVIAHNLDSEEVRQKVKMVLGNTDNPDGSLGFFHTRNFSFGDFVYVSKLYETLKQVPQVNYGIISIFRKSSLRAMERESKEPYVKRDNETLKNLEKGYMAVREYEIIKLDNDPFHPENGILKLDFVQEDTENNSNSFLDDWGAD